VRAVLLGNFTPAGKELAAACLSSNVTITAGGLPVGAKIELCLQVVCDLIFREYGSKCSVCFRLVQDGVGYGNRVVHVNRGADGIRAVLVEPRKRWVHLHCGSNYSGPGINANAGRHIVVLYEAGVQVNAKTKTF